MLVALGEVVMGDLFDLTMIDECTREGVRSR
jgi:hypothetical protein